MKRSAVVIVLIGLALPGCARVRNPAGSELPQAASTTSETTGPTATPTASPTVLSSSVDIPEASFHEDPPPPDASPAVTADQAVSAAFVPDSPNITSAQPVLVLFTGGMTDPTTGQLQYQDVLAWDVVETGCFPHPQGSPLPGTDQSPAPCANTEHSVVDATSGELLLSLDI